MSETTNLAERTVKLVKTLGASHCDVVVVDSTNIVAEIEKSSVKQASEISDVGIGIRAFRKGCCGFAYSTGLDFKVIKRVAQLAVSEARSGTQDPDFKDLPWPSNLGRGPGLFDKKIVELAPDDVVEMAISLADVASSDKRVTSVNAGVGVGRSEVALANSNGVSCSQKFSAFETSAEVVAKSGKSMFSAMDAGSTRRMDSGLVRRVGEKARVHALMGLKQIKLSTGDYPVVVDPLSIGFILLSAIGGGANAEGIQRKRSYLAGHLGETIGSSMLSISDDPTLPWSSGSYLFDGEGFPGKRNVLIKQGKLTSFLHDSYTSGKESVSNTGNASRGGSLWGFRRPPSISSSNLVVEPGEVSFDEMIRDTRKGVFLRATFDYPNLATGEFSGLMMESYLVDHGEIGPALKQSTMGISMLDMFSRVDMVGRDQTEAFGVKTPPIRIAKARIAGSL